MSEAAPLESATPDSPLAQFIRQNDDIRILRHPHQDDAKNPVLALNSVDQFGNKGFRLSWWGIDKPFVMESKTHAHDFDQYLIFAGGNLNDLPDLGGVVELSLGWDEQSLEKFVFTTATMVYIPRGMLHCPLDFKEVRDPKHPILFHDFYFSPDYFRSTEIGDQGADSQYEAFIKKMPQ
jgi:hypothetical protein